MNKFSNIAMALAVATTLAACAPKAETAADAAPTGADAAKADAGKTVTQLMSQSFTPEQQGRILNMGYHMAASALCPELEVDAARMGKAVEATLALDSAGATPAQAQHQRDALLMFLGMSSGAIIGSHIGDKAKFCEDAAKADDAGPDAHLFVQGAPSAPSTAPVPQAPSPTEPAKTP
jgi:hypothetical protein